MKEFTLDDCPHTEIKCMDCMRIIPTSMLDEMLNRPDKSKCDHPNYAILRNEFHPDEIIEYCTVCKEEL